MKGYIDMKTEKKKTISSAEALTNFQTILTHLTGMVIANVWNAHEATAAAEAMAPAPCDRQPWRRVPRRRLFVRRRSRSCTRVPSPWGIEVEVISPGESGPTPKAASELLENGDEVGGVENMAIL